MGKTYRVPTFVSASNRVIKLMLRVGMKPGAMALLTVRGRKSGLPRTTPVAIVELNGQRLLLGAFGEVDWVRNLRAAKEATLQRGRHPEHIVVDELPPVEAAPLLKQILVDAPGFLLKNFEAESTSPLEEFEREARNHPVFRLR